MGIFNVNFDEIGRQLLPSVLRKTKIYAFVRVLLTGVKTLYARFQNARQRNLYDLRHRQHVRHLEAVLNDAFDPAFRRIIIIDAPVQYEPIYLYLEPEERPVSVFTEFEAKHLATYTEYEIDEEGIDFVVQVNYSIPYDVARMHALIDKYKTPGMAYIIEEVI